MSRHDGEKTIANLAKESAVELIFSNACQKRSPRVLLSA
jgi:hypothetical protein